MIAKLSRSSIPLLDRTLIAILVASIAILMVGLLSWQIPLGAQVQLETGSVAKSDVIAPRQLTFDSQILTDIARERAAQSVPDQYDVAEGRIRRRQVTRAQELIEFISTVRADPYAAPEVQIDYLLAITDLALTPEVARTVLELSDDEWIGVANDVPIILDIVMRDEIRDTSLAAARRKVAALVDSDITESTGQATVELTRALIRPNSFVNPERTEEMRAGARDAVPVQTVKIEDGEIIIRAGDLAKAEDVEALTQIGLQQSDWDWWTMAQSVLFTLTVFGVVGMALYRLRPQTLSNLQEMAILAVTISIWLLAAKFMIIPHEWLPFLYPLAALTMLLAVLIDVRVAVVIGIGFVFTIQYMGTSNAVLMVYTGAGSLLGALILGRAERMAAFVWAGLIVVISNIVTMAVYRLPYSEYSTTALLQLHLVLLLNGGLSASLALIGYFVMGNIFGITTSLQLTELSRPTHPLLRQLLLKSAGTYHHTIVVSNLAERAAAAIGADAFLSRVGAYYHDIGKTVRPYFFTENIVDGNSPHDKLDPYTSAQIIISHVNEGLELADKYHLPPRIRDFIREHHGRSLVKYFYIQAQNQAEPGTEVNEDDFRYPGPSPRSKETAIMLLADTCEAAVRSIRPGTREELKSLITRLVDERIADGDLDESNLTFKEVQTVREVFIRVLEGVHHPRISYPEPVKKGATTTDTGAPPAQTPSAQTQGSNAVASKRHQSPPASERVNGPQGGFEDIAMHSADRDSAHGAEVPGAPTTQIEKEPS